MASHWWLALVADGATCDARLEDEHGAECGRWTHLTDVLAWATSIRSQLEAAPLGLILAGLESAALDPLAAVLPPLRQAWMCRRWEAELAGALRGGVGVVLHSDLRARAMAVNADGRAILVQQEEDLLGEEGSALWLGTRALRMALQGQAGRMQRSERLERSLLGSFGRDSLDELVADFERGAIHRDEMAGFVPVLLHLAAYPDPDPACRALVLGASRRLATLVRSALARLHEDTSGGTTWPERGQERHDATGRAMSPAPELEVGVAPPDASWVASIGGELRGAWSGAAMQFALLDAFLEDVARYVPGLLWDAAASGTLEGAAMLGRAAAAASHPEQPSTLTRVVRAVDRSGWRHLFELSRQARRD